MNPSQLSRGTLPILAALTLTFGSTLVFAQGGGGAPAGGAVPTLTPAQTTAIGAMDQALTNQTAAATSARAALLTATYASPKSDADLKVKLDQLSNAELALARARADQFTTLQASADKLSAEQIPALIAMGARGGRGGGRGGGAAANLDPGMSFARPTESPGLGKPMALPKPDAEGFVSMFNGKDLSGWDALPNYWTVKDGFIDCTENLEPGGNLQSNLTWLDSLEHPEKYTNFELHVSIRFVSHTGNSGVQFRSRINNEATKHAGGYQADMDAPNQYWGGLHDENSLNGPHRSGGPGPHMGPRGFKTTYPADGGAAKLEPLAEDAQTIAALVRPVGEFNDLVIVADGPHITIKLNGHLSSDVIDNYPSSLKSGVIAFQQHAGFQLDVQFKDPKIKLLPAKP